jgi:small subunit ribosomal protein S18
MSEYFRRKNKSRLDTDAIDYKNTKLLEDYITENHKIVPSRITGTPMREQREIALAIKRARFIGLLAYCDGHR